MLSLPGKRFSLKVLNYMVVEKRTSAFLHHLLLSPTNPAEECQKDREVWEKEDRKGREL